MGAGYRGISVALAFVLAGCTSAVSNPSEPNWQDFKGVSTRQEFVARWAEQDPNWTNVQEPVRGCVLEGIEKATPPRFLEAVDAFVADQTSVRWEDVMAADRATDWGPANDQAEKIAADCKAKYGS